jgi:thiamine-monophosphate kinase
LRALATHALATHPAARGLADDVALLGDLVLTHDTIVEGVHYLPDRSAESVGWKLAAVNLSDLAAKGAEPAGACSRSPSPRDDEWEKRFLRPPRSLRAFRPAAARRRHGGASAGAPRVLGLTAIGKEPGPVPSRRAGSPATVCGWSAPSAMPPRASRLLAADPSATGPLVEAYRRPIPLLPIGARLPRTPPP